MQHRRRELAYDRPRPRDEDRQERAAPLPPEPQLEASFTAHLIGQFDGASSEPSAVFAYEAVSQAATRRPRSREPYTGPERRSQIRTAVA